MATNADIQAEFNKLLSEASKLLEGQQTHMQKQVDLLKQMAAAQKSINSMIGEGKLSEMSDVLKDMNDHLEENTKKYEEALDGLEDYNEALDEQLTVGEKLSKHMLELGKRLKALKPGEAVLNGISSGFALFANTAGGFISTGATLVDVLSRLTVGIIAFPLNVLGNLTAMAGNAQTTTAFADALEMVRKQFGYLDQTSGLAIRNMQKGMGQLANTGLSAFRVFGTSAEQLDAVREYAEALGPVFLRASQVIGEQGAGALFAYNRALGLAPEAQKAVAARAVASGRTVNEVNRDIANYAIQMSEAFGVSMKEVARDVGNMMADLDHFGHLAPKELTQVAVYARKLGLEFKALAAIMDKTLTFEDAANQASQLSQAFGLNIDAFEQMREQDPGKQLDNLRKAFFAAGRSIENMTRQERALLAQQTGLDQESLNAAFSLKNQGVAYDDIRRKGDAARKSQLTQEQVMLKLANAIERFNQQGSSFSGFLDAFMKGFDIGIKRTPVFIRLMMNLRRTMSVLFRAGREVGKAFVDMFPGVKQIFEGIGDFFDPSRMRTMMRSYVNAFKEFFRDLDAGKLFQKLREGFMSFADSPAGRKLLDGIKQFLTAGAKVVNTGFRYMLAAVRDGLKFLTDVVTGKASLGLGGAGGAVGGFLGPVFQELTKDLGPIASQLWDALKGLASVVFDKLSDFAYENLHIILAVVFGPSAILGIGKGLVAAGGKALGSLFVSMFQSAAPTVQKGAAGLLQRLTPAQAQAASTGTQAASVIPPGASQAAEEANRVKNPASAATNLKSVGVFLLGMAVLVAAIAVLAIAVKKYNITIASVGIAAAMLAAAALVLLAINGAVLAASAIQPAALASGMAGVAAAGLFGGALALGMFGLVTLFKGVTLGQIGVVVAAVGAAVLVMLAVGAGIAAASALSATWGLAAAAAAGVVAAGLFAAGLAYGMSKLAEQFKATDLGSVDKVSALVTKGTTIVLQIAGAISLIGVAGPLILAGMITAGVVLYALKRLLPSALSILSDITGQMIGTVSSIMRNINAIPFDDSSERKVNAFVRVLSGLGTFVGAIGQVLSQAAPSFTDFMTGNNTAAARLAEIPTAFRGISSSVASIVTTVSSAAESLGTGPEAENKLKAAGVIADIIGSVSSFVKNLGDVVQASVSDVSSFDRIVSAFADTADPVRARMTQVSSFMTDVVQQVVVPMIRRIIDAMPQSFTQQQARAAMAVAELLKGITEVVKAVVPSPEMITAINRGANFHGQMEGIRSLLSSVMNLVTGDRGVLGQVSQMITSIPNLSDRQASQLKSISGVLESVFRGIASIADVISTVARSGATASPGNVSSIASQTELMNNLFNRVGSLIPSIINQLRGVGLSDTEARGIQGKTKAVKAVFEVMQVLASTFNAFSTGPGRQINVNSIYTAINAVAVNAANMFSDTNEPARHLKNAIIGLQSFPSVDGVVPKLNAIKTLFEAFKTVGESVGAVNQLSGTSFGTAIGKITDELKNAEPQLREFRTLARDRISTTIREMVRDVNDVSRAFANITPINIVSNLQRTADNMGLMQNQQFRIERGRINLQVNAQIYLDAAELEYLLLVRPNSQFQRNEVSTPLAPPPRGIARNPNRVTAGGGGG